MLGAIPELACPIAFRALYKHSADGVGVVGGGGTVQVLPDHEMLMGAELELEACGVPGSAAETAPASVSFLFRYQLMLFSEV